MMTTVEMVARFLEDFAYEVEDEGRARKPMLPKTEDSWTGFVHDAEKLLAKIDRASGAPPPAPLPPEDQR